MIGRLAIVGNDKGGAMTTASPLVVVGKWLQENGYRHVCVTPATHSRVNARASAAIAQTLADIFGWSRPFESSFASSVASPLLPDFILDAMRRANVLEENNGLFASRVRYSTLDDGLYVHSAFPTLSPDAVFFGPDTYRFASFIKDAIARNDVGDIRSIVDVGCGTGAGGIVATRAAETARQLILTDINATALHYAACNAELAGIEATFQHCDLFSGLEQPVDLIVANPPYLVDPEARLYRNGGGTHGSELSLRIIREGIEHLAPGGRLLLYSGSPIVKGRDLLKATVDEALHAGRVSYTYTELDPDVFGEELELNAYADVDRIAVVGLIVQSTAPSARKSGARVKEAEVAALDSGF